MNDMSPVIIPKSDQLGADDLLAGPRTITITKVDIKPGTEQPVTINYEGDEGHPWKCCKSMARVLVAAWGADAKAYVGRSCTLYRDPEVKWGGMAVGGIRVSHMSHISGQMVLALTATRGSKKAYTVKPLAQPSQKPQDSQFDLAAWSDQIVNALPSYATADDLRTAWSERRAELKAKMPERFAEVNAKVNARGGELSVGAD